MEYNFHFSRGGDNEFWGPQQKLPKGEYYQVILIVVSCFDNSSGIISNNEILTEICKLFLDQDQNVRSV